MFKMANNIFYNLKVGIKTTLVQAIASIIIFVLALVLMGISLTSLDLDKLNNIFSGIYLLLIPLSLFFQGFFIIKFRNWIFK